MCKKIGKRNGANIFNSNQKQNLNNEGYLPKNKNILENYKFLFETHKK